MSYSEYSAFQQNPWNAGQQAWGQGGQFGHNGGQGYGSGLGQAAFGQQGFGGAGGWQQGQGWGGNPWQRQLSHHDIGEVVRHLIPLLPQIVGQAQQPQAAFGYGGFGNSGFGGGYGGYGGGFGGGAGGYAQRQLSPQDVQEVVRQILPVVPQIISLLQGQHQGPLASAIYGGQGQGQGWGQQGGFGQGLFGQGGYGQQWGQGQGWGQGLGQAAYGNAGGRQFSQYEVGEIVRHLTAALPQVISNLHAFNQQQQQRGV